MSMVRQVCVEERYIHIRGTPQKCFSASLTQADATVFANIMSQVLVLPQPLPASSVVLGQLLSNPLDLRSTSMKPTVKLVCSKLNTQPCYEDVIFQDEEGRFFSSLDKTNTSLGRSVVLTADEVSLTALADPAGAFEALRHDTRTQAFLRKSALRRQPLYFVTGIQKLLNASYRILPGKEVFKSKTTGCQSKSPLHLRRDSAELEPEGDTKSTIFAVELMKVICRVGAKAEPHTLKDIGYVWTYHTLDNSDLQLSIGLGKVLQPKELRALAGIVIDENLRRERHVHQHYEAEGLGGFPSN